MRNATFTETAKKVMKKKSRLKCRKKAERKKFHIPVSRLETSTFEYNDNGRFKKVQRSKAHHRLTDVNRETTLVQLCEINEGRKSRRNLRPASSLAGHGDTSSSRGKIVSSCPEEQLLGKANGNHH